MKWIFMPIEVLGVEEVGTYVEREKEEVGVEEHGEKPCQAGARSEEAVVLCQADAD